MKRKSVVVVLVLAITITPLFVLGWQAQAKKNLRVYAPPWIWKKSPLQKAAQRFEKDHPDVNVELTKSGKWSGPEYIAKWKTGESPMDVFVGVTGTQIAPVIAGNWLEPLGDLLKGKMAKDKFVQGFLTADYFKNPKGEGGYYPMLPFMGEVAVIGTNTSLMKKAGLWENGQPQPIPSFKKEELFPWFKKLNEASPLGAHVQIWDREYMQYDYLGPLKAMGANILEEDGKGWNVSSEAAKRWLNYLQELYEKGYGKWTSSNESGYTKWKTGACGSFYAAQSHNMELVKVTEDPSDLAFLGWPGAEKNGSVIWDISVWIPKVSPNIDLAKEFIREQIFSKFYQQWSFNHYGKLPTLKGYFGEGITWYQAQMPKLRKIANQSQPIPMFKDNATYLDIVHKYLPKAAFGRMSVEKAINKIQKESKGLDLTRMRATAEEK